MTLSFLQNILLSGLLGGVILVPFVDVVTKDIKNTKITYLIALFTSIVMGAIVVALQGKFALSSLNDPTTLFQAIGTVFITSQTLYKLYWQNSLTREKLNQRMTNKPVSTVQVSQVVEPNQGLNPIQSQDASSV